MTKGKKRHRFLYRYAQITLSRLWENILEMKVALSYGTGSTSLRQMAELFPAGQELRYPPTDDDDAYSNSKIYWLRLRNGLTCVRDNTCTTRIERIYPDLRKLRKHPVWDMLGNPTMSVRDIREVLLKLEAELEGKLINVKTTKPDIIFKRRHWSPNNAELVESLGGFALKLALFRLSKLQPLNNAQRYNPKSLVLHLLRLVTQKKWSQHGDRLIRLLLVFIEVNENDITDKAIEKILINNSEDITFQKLFLWVTQQEGSPQFHSLSDYIQANRNLAQNFWMECFPDALQYPVSWRVTMETLFWADTYSDLWLYKGIPKEKLFCPGSPVFTDQLKTFFVGNRRQIW